MYYQSGINPDWCFCPNWKRTTLTATLFVFICFQWWEQVVVSLFSYSRWHERIFFPSCYEATFSTSFSEQVETTEEDIHLFSLFTNFFLISFPDWMLSWLTAWMVGSLSHWTLTGSSLTRCVSFAGAGVERDSRAAQALTSGISARFFSLSVLLVC